VDDAPVAPHDDRGGNHERLVGAEGRPGRVVHDDGRWLDLDGLEVQVDDAARLREDQDPVDGLADKPFGLQGGGDVAAGTVRLVLAGFAEEQQPHPPARGGVHRAAVDRPHHERRGGVTTVQIRGSARRRCGQQDGDDGGQQASHGSPPLPPGPGAVRL
jgi:hypothetical protein